jgi:hypothetical protein
MPIRQTTKIGHILAAHAHPFGEVKCRYGALEGVGTLPSTVDESDLEGWSDQGNNQSRHSRATPKINHPIGIGWHGVGKPRGMANDLRGRSCAEGANTLSLNQDSD